MKTTSIAALLAILTIFSLSAADKALPDRPAPPLHLEKLLQTPPDAVATWDALKGKVVVLEFWATWCGPCIEAVPHLNEMADEFEKQPVLFIAITDEKESVVQPFLRRKSMRAWVGLDTDRSMFKEYGVSGIPHTVIVGTNGVIAAVTHPASLSATHIKNVLAGKPAGLPTPSPDEKTVAAKPSDDNALPAPIFQVLIRPSEAGEGGGGGGSSGPAGNSPYGRMYRSKTDGSSLLGLVLWAVQTTEVRLVTNSALPDGKFDVLINLPWHASKRIPELLREALRTTFGLISNKEKREMDVYILTASNSKLGPTVSTGGSSSSSGLGRISAVNSSLTGLAWSLENLLGRPVLDETGLTNRYDYQLKWKQPDGQRKPDVDTLRQALRDQLGLDLTPAKRAVEVTIVDLAKPEDSP
jgi:uncharacterized protein (TIGR03435 family)